MSDLLQSNRKLADAYRDAIANKLSRTIDPSALLGSPDSDPQKFYLEFKNQVAQIVHEETETLKKEILQSDDCHLLLLKRTALVDEVVKTAFQTAVWYYNHRHQTQFKPQEIPIAIVARGGYGREEMFLRSDVDIHIVINVTKEQTETESIPEISKYFEYLFIFQNIFPTASHSCLFELSGLDEEYHPEKMHDFFALLEHRFVAGSAHIYTEFKSSLKTATLLHQKEILKYCLQHRTYYDVQNTVFQQEPNVKEELRRLYWALALVRIRQNLEATNQFELLEVLFNNKTLNKKTYNKMKFAFNFLVKVRLLLHAHQPEAHRDVMSYEVREKIAESMGYELIAFYNEYFYRAGLPLKRYSRNLFQESIAFDTKMHEELSKYFALSKENQIIFNGGTEAAGSAPLYLMLEVFAWVSEKNYRISYPVMRFLEDRLAQAGPLGFNAKEAQAVQGFFKRVMEGQYYSKAIRLLHEFGLLGNYFIPDFKNLCGLLQDIYVHKFPTDMHILSALDALNLLDTDPNADAFLVELYRSLKDKTAIRLAVLLHDIGKGAEDKSVNEEMMGARMIPGILARLGYADKKKRVDDLAFLVEKHLTMYDLMLLDPEADDTYEMVWDLVEHDRERLKMLVLLTYADRAGTKMKMSPTQIEQLKIFYQYTLHHKKHEEVPQSVKLEFLQMVRLPKDLQSQLETYYAFSRSKEKLAVEFLFKPDQPSELVVCARDQKGLLFNVSTVLAFNQLNIVEANIQTFNDNAFDVFKVVSREDSRIDYSNFYFVQKQVKQDLKRILVEGDSFASIFKGRTLSNEREKHPYRDVKLKIKIIGRSVTLSTHDLIGTFMMETKVFAQLGMEIQRSVIHTQQGTASNIFYIRPEDVEKIHRNHAEFESMLKKALLPLIQSDPLFLEETVVPVP